MFLSYFWPCCCYINNVPFDGKRGDTKWKCGTDRFRRKQKLRHTQLLTLTESPRVCWWDLIWWWLATTCGNDRMLLFSSCLNIHSLYSKYKTITVYPFYKLLYILYIFDHIVERNNVFPSLCHLPIQFSSNLPTHVLLSDVFTTSWISKQLQFD